jgi:hypothetical protein
MHICVKNNVEIYIPKNFDDLDKLCSILHNVTNYVIIDCSYTKILNSLFISSIINNKFIILVGVSYTSYNIIKVIGACDAVQIYKDIDSALLVLK